MRLRLAFMGTPDFAVPALDALLARGHAIAAVYSQPPRPAGRGQRVQASPVQLFAEAHGLAVRTPRTLRDPTEQANFAALQLDAAVVAAYGLILPKPILAAPRLGCVNIHASLLPRWRGAAPIQRAILAGDTATGVTIMQMDEGLDTGPMLRAERVPIGPKTKASALHDRLAALGARLVVATLDELAAGRAMPVAQPTEGVTYAAKLSRDEGQLDWRKTAHELERAVRALNPWPGVWFESPAGRIKLLEAELADGAGTPGLILDHRLTVACGEGALRPLRLQRAGREPAETEAFLRGCSLPPGTRLPCPATS
jgi:methionyl-tRNA formyltransferase